MKTSFLNLLVGFDKGFALKSTDYKADAFTTQFDDLYLLSGYFKFSFLIQLKRNFDPAAIFVNLKKFKIF